MINSKVSTEHQQDINRPTPSTRHNQTCFKHLSEDKMVYADFAQQAEYMATNATNCEAIRLCKLLTKLTSQSLNTTVIYYDNQSCIKL